MGKMDENDLENVLTHSSSVLSLKEALRRALDIIYERDDVIINLQDELEISQLREEPDL